MEKLYLTTNALVMFKNNDKRFVYQKESEDFRGMYVTIPNLDDVEGVTLSLDKAGMPYTALNPATLFFQAKNHDEMNSIHRVINVPRFFNVVSNEYQDTLAKAHAVNHSKIYLEKGRLEERNFMKLHSTYGHVRIIGRSGDEIVRVLNTKTGEGKSLNKRLHDVFSVEEDTTFQLNDPYEMKYSFSDSAYELFMKKGSYHIFKLVDKADNVKGYTIEKAS